MKYPYINIDNLELHLTYDECNLFLKSDITNKHKGGYAINQWKLSTIISKYLLLCNGKTTHNEIIKDLDLAFDVMGDHILQGLMDIGVVSISDTKMKSKEMFVTGSFDTCCPLHISLELTDYCNFRCKHCYVCANPDKLEEVEYDKIIDLIQLLKNNGVKVIELTGGECTTYSRFKDVLKYCSDNFQLVSVISNGYLIGKDDTLSDYISSFENVCVQISIDGMEEFHDYFRNKKGAFKYACSAVEKLTNKGVLVRVASSITNENLTQVKQLYHLCKKLDVDAWAISPVGAFGRGIELELDISVLKEELEKELSNYANDKLFSSNIESIKSSIKNNEINCGAGWRTFALNATSGNFRACLFLDESKSIENAYCSSYKDIFKEEKISVYKNIPNPSKYLPECRGCEYVELCNGCFAKAFKIIEAYNPKCPWKDRYIK